MPIADSVVAEINAAVEQTVKSQEDAKQTSEETKAEETKVESSAASIEPEVKPETKTDDNKDGGGDDGKVTAIGAADNADDTPPPDDKPGLSAATVTISDSALTRAVQVGFTLDEARQFPNDATLNKAVQKIEATERAWLEADTALKNQSKKDEKPAEDDPLAKLPKLDPEVYEPEVIQMFDALTGVIKQQQEAIKQFREQGEYAARSSQEAAARDVEQWFDKQIETLGEDFHEPLGKGAYGNLDRGSAQFQKRDAIANQMAVMIAGYQSIGQPVPPREKIFEIAAKAILADEYATIKEKKLSGELKKRSAQHIQRGSSQKTKSTQTPLEQVAQAIDEKFFNK